MYTSYTHRNHYNVNGIDVDSKHIPIKIPFKLQLKALHNFIYIGRCVSTVVTRSRNCEYIHTHITYTFNSQKDQNNTYLTSYDLCMPCGVASRPAAKSNTIKKTPFAHIGRAQAYIYNLPACTKKKCQK